MDRVRKKGKVEGTVELGWGGFGPRCVARSGWFRGLGWAVGAWYLDRVRVRRKEGSVSVLGKLVLLLTSLHFTAPHFHASCHDAR